MQPKYIFVFCYMLSTGLLAENELYRLSVIPEHVAVCRQYESDNFDTVSSELHQFPSKIQIPKLDTIGYPFVTNLVVKEKDKVAEDNRGAAKYRWRICAPIVERKESSEFLFVEISEQVVAAKVCMLSEKDCIEVLFLSMEKNGLTPKVSEMRSAPIYSNYFSKGDKINYELAISQIYRTDSVSLSTHSIEPLNSPPSDVDDNLVHIGTPRQLFLNGAGQDNAVDKTRQVGTINIFPYAGVTNK